MKRLTLTLVVIVGLALRLWFAICCHGNFDLVQFEHSAAIFREGGNIYVNQFYFNYSPLVGLPLALVAHLPLPFDFAWRLFLTVIGLLNAVLIARLTKHSALTFMALWLNPALILFDGYVGQFEALALFPLLLLLNRPFIGGVLALVVKHLCLPMTWTLYVYRAGTYKRAVLWMIAALALFLLSFVFYLPSGASSIMERVFLYHSWPGYGFGSTALFFVAILLLPFVARALHLELLDALLFVALGQMVFMYGAGSNNFYAVLILGMLRPSRFLIPLTVVYLLLVSPWTGLEMATPVNTNNALWLVCFVWFGAILWQHRLVFALSFNPVQKARMSNV